MTSIILCRELSSISEKIVDNLAEHAIVQTIIGPVMIMNQGVPEHPGFVTVARDGKIVVSLRGISKNFDVTRAVDNVDLDLIQGEVHGLVGENGAGKSTLMRVLAGFFTDYDGTIAVEGRFLDIVSPAQASGAGIALVHQELSLLPELTVAENIFLGREPSGRFPGLVSFSTMARRAKAALSECGVAIDPLARVNHLGLAERQLVEIVKGVAGAPRVLILDEPTSSLTIKEVRELFFIVRRLAERGTAVVYISHKLDEIFAVTNRITVLRDGRKVASAPTGEWTERGLVRAMVGRDLSALFPHEPLPPGRVRLEVCNLRRNGVFGPISFILRQREIVGLYGIIGAGRSEVAEVLFGLSRADSGEIFVDGRPVSFGTAAKALVAGLAMVPEDRHARGLVPMLSVATNLSLSALSDFTTIGFINRTAERVAVASFLRRLAVRIQSPMQEITSLSGGNQQKVVIGRSLMPSPRILILDEPTRGVDVVAKAEIHCAIDKLADQGLAVLLISSELPEVLGMSDRILVMRDGVIVSELPRADASEETLVAMAAGVKNGQ
jgi:ABC-type sugar transport system ATPase subunit